MRLLRTLVPLMLAMTATPIITATELEPCPYPQCLIGGTTCNWVCVGIHAAAMGFVEVDGSGTHKHQHKHALLQQREQAAAQQRGNSADQGEGFKFPGVSSLLQRLERVESATQQHLAARQRQKQIVDSDDEIDGVPMTRAQFGLNPYTESDMEEEEDDELPGDELDEEEPEEEEDEDIPEDPSSASYAGMTNQGSVSGIVASEAFNPDNSFTPFRRAQVGLRPPDAEWDDSAITSLLQRLERIESATQQHLANKQKQIVDSDDTIDGEPIQRAQFGLNPNSVPDEEVPEDLTSPSYAGTGSTGSVTGIVDVDEPNPDGTFTPFRRAQVGLRPDADSEDSTITSLLQRLERVEFATQQHLSAQQQQKQIVDSEDTIDGEPIQRAQFGLNPYSTPDEEGIPEDSSSPSYAGTTGSVTGIVDVDEPNPDGTFTPFRRAQVGLNPDASLLERITRLEQGTTAVLAQRRVQTQGADSTQQHASSSDEYVVYGGAHNTDGSWFHYAAGDGKEEEEEQQLIENNNEKAQNQPQAVLLERATARHASSAASRTHTHTLTATHTRSGLRRLRAAIHAQQRP